MRFRNISSEALYMPALRLSVAKFDPAAEDPDAGYTPDFDDDTAAAFVLQTDVWEAENPAAAEALTAKITSAPSSRPLPAPPDQDTAAASAAPRARAKKQEG
ncbi:MAG TPA: hypothetical protein VFW64_12250 [Pseudonocardiaceae bacterium]|nr:hypothetical protein [Pseudonocardiaceae bacterium]